MATWGYGVGNGLMALLTGIAGSGALSKGSTPAGPPPMMSAGQDMPRPIATSPGVAGADRPGMAGLLENEGFLRALGAMGAGFDPRLFPAARGLSGYAAGEAHRLERERERQAEEDAASAAAKREDEIALQRAEQARRALDVIGPQHASLKEFATGDDPLGNVAEIVRMMRGEQAYQRQEEERRRRAARRARPRTSSRGGVRQGSVRGGNGRLDDIRRTQDAPADMDAPPASAPVLTAPRAVSAPSRLGQAAAAPIAPGPFRPPPMPATPPPAPGIRYPGAPPINTVEEGYRYIGGPPEDPRSWVPVEVG